MDTILHLEHQGKTARLSLQSLPRDRPKPIIQQSTKTGIVSSYRLLNGINAAFDPTQAQPEDLIAGDPELVMAGAGQILEPEMISAAYFNECTRNECSPSAGLAPVTDFKFIDIIYDAEGNEKERRPHIIRKSNLNDRLPIKIGKRMPITQAFTSFVIRHTHQILHEDGVTMEFLFKIAQDLHQNQEVAVVGAGAKGNQPLVVREKGTPYRGFLYGEIGTGENDGKYKLLLLLSDRELKNVEE